MPMLSGPGLILLDLNMPRMDECDALAEIKRVESLGTIPAVILTASGNEDDSLKTYNLHANAYIIKPFDLTRFLNLVKMLPPKEGD